MHVLQYLLKRSVIVLLLDHLSLALEKVNANETYALTKQDINCALLREHFEYIAIFIERKYHGITFGSFDSDFIRNKCS